MTDDTHKEVNDIKMTVHFSDFHSAFIDMNREENFTYEGFQALFDYLEEYEDSTGEEMALDVTDLCRNYTEYSDLKDFQANYGAEGYETLYDIQDATIYIPVGKYGFIIQNF